MLWLLLLLGLVAAPVAAIALLKPSILASVGVVAAIMVGLALLITGLAFVSLQVVTSRADRS